MDLVSEIKKVLEKQNFYDHLYLDTAKVWANASKCLRKKVGAVLVKDNNIISIGFNGTPQGFENECELPKEADSVEELGETKWYVLHAEENAICKLAATGSGGCEGATMYLTLSPCKNCAKLIYRAGIKRVVFIKAYSDQEGVEFLRKAGVEVAQRLDE